MDSTLKTSVIAIASLAVAGLVSGCGGHPQSTGRDSHAASPRPVISLSQAQAVLSKYTPINDEANAQQNSQLLATIETGSLFQQDTASYQQVPTLSASDRKKFSAPLSYEPATFYIPTTGNWFLVYSAMSGVDVKKGSHQLCIFQRVDGVWKMVTAVYLDPGTQLPPISKDKQGFASAVDGGSTVGPVALSSLGHAVNDLYLTGGKGPAKQLADTPVKRHMLSDYATRNDWIKYPTAFRTGYQEASAQNDKNLKIYRDAYALRTTDGGALVLFTSYLDKDDFTTMPWQFNVSPGDKQNIYIKQKPGEQLMAIHATWSTQDAVHVTPSGQIVQLGGDTQLIDAKGIDAVPTVNPSSR